MKNFSGEIAGTTVWCPPMGGVCLREVSISGSSTAVYQEYVYSWVEMNKLANALMNALH